MATVGAELAQSSSPSAASQFEFDISALKYSSPVVDPSFNRRFVAADLVCIASGAFIAIAWRFPSVVPSIHPVHANIRQSDPTLTLADHLGISILYAALIILLCNTQGLYSPYRPVSRYREMVDILHSILTATLLLGGALFVSGVKSTSRLVIGFTAAYAFLAMFGWREFRRRSLSKGLADGLSCHNVMIVGTNPTALALAHHLTQHRQLGLVVIGHLGDPPITPSEAAPQILGSPADLKDICRTHFADEVIICSQHRPTVLQAIADAREAGLGVRVIPDLYDGMAFGADLHYLGDFPSMSVSHRSLPAFSLKFKRLFDIFVSASGLLLLAPLFALLAIIVKRNSPGPVFYASTRVGRKGREFRCYKFRTMVADADRKLTELNHLNERQGILFKITNDPRITRCGRVMRKYSLDELPQLWNVFKGDMSLVGPRPPLASEVRQYELEYLRRLEAAPGITGLWQVEARNHPSFDRYIKLDLKYIEHWTFALDLHILLRTVAVVFAGTGS